MRQHGTYACYSFGPEPGQGKGCRCDDCRKASAAYERERKRRTTPAYVDADRARKHVEWLRTQGVGAKAIAAAAGISGGAMSKLIYGDPTRNRGPSKRIRHSTETAILSVTAWNVKDGARVPGDNYRRDIQALREKGWTYAAISREIGCDQRNLRPEAASVTAARARAVHELLTAPVPEPKTRTGLGAVAARNYDEAQAQAVRDSHADYKRNLRVRNGTTIKTRDPIPVPSIDPAVFDEPWRGRAACRLLAPDERWIFWPGRGDHLTIRAAKKVCASCPVAKDCLRYALEAGELGVWGGTSDKERRNLRKAAA